MSKAFQQLCQLCSPNRSREDINDDLDWMAIWQLAKRHRVVPVLSDRLKQLGILAPDDIKSRITKHNINNLHQGLQQAAELVRLTKLFGEHNIPFVAFKGIALSKLMGLELHQRHNGDIDLLLANADDLWQVDDLLVKKGYLRHDPDHLLQLNASQQKFFECYGKDLVYLHPETKIRLELHFKLFNNNRLLDLPAISVYQNRTFIKVGTTSIPIMNKTDHQLYLLIHGALSGWFRLKWLCDIPLISQNGEAFLSTRFLTEIKKQKIERIVLQSLWLANQQLDMPISNLIKHSYRDKKISNKLVKLAKAQQYANAQIKADSLKKNVLYACLLKSGFYYKCNQIIMHLTNFHDWQKLPLAHWLFWLYFPLRPLLWLKRQ